MSEKPEEKNEAAAQTPQLNTRILAQYIRDMSFENILAQKGVEGETDPEIKIQVNLDAKKRSVKNQYEVVVHTKIESNTKSSGQPMFLLELDYGSIFQIEGLPEDQLHPYLMIECPRLMFPYLRRIVSDITRDGGFPPLNLEMIDFMKMYRTEIQRRVEEQKQAQKPN